MTIRKPAAAAARVAKKAARVTAPTQVKHPWRATLRTAAAGAVALLPLVPELVAGAHLDTTALGVQTVAAAAGVTRLLAIPAVDDWLRRFVPFLSTTPKK